MKQWQQLSASQLLFRLLSLLHLLLSCHLPSLLRVPYQPIPQPFLLNMLYWHLHLCQSLHQIQTLHPIPLLQLKLSLTWLPSDDPTEDDTVMLLGHLAVWKTSLVLLQPRGNQATACGSLLPLPLPPGRSPCTSKCQVAGVSLLGPLSSRCKPTRTPVDTNLSPFHVPVRTIPQ